MRFARLVLVATVILSFALVPVVSAHSSTLVIKMTPAGFAPQEAASDENTTIIFVNQDIKPRWPASNIHPTHEIYPEFDPKHEIKPGESWSFKPTRPGKWNYHDHLVPHLRGKLIVEKENQKQTSSSPSFLQPLITQAKTFFQKILQLFKVRPVAVVDPETFKKMPPAQQFEALKKITTDSGSKSAWDYVNKTYQGEAGSSGNIHDLAHLAGKLIYEEIGVGGISTCTSQFAFGCYHGLLDAAFQNDLTLLAKAEVECINLGPANSGPYGSCVHGIGHGVASFYQTKELKQALLTCDVLPQGQGFCYDGVFMEFARGAPPSFYRADDPYFPCNQLEKEFGTKYSTACGRNQPSILMSKFKIGFDEVTRACFAPLSDDFRNACFDALGFSLANLKTSEEIVKNCNKIKSPQFLARCLQSAAGELIFQDVPGWQEKSNRVCDASPKAYLALCRAHTEKIIRDYGRKEKFSLLPEGQDENEYIRAQMRACYTTGGKNDCYREVALLFSEQFGLAKTIRLFAQNEQYPEIYARCHEATHYLSRNEYKKTRSVAAVYAQCDSTCHGGCYHGVLEQYLKEKNLTIEALAEEFPKVCGKTENFETPLIFNECLHGLGHAAIFVTDMEVPQSLALCDTLADQETKERCQSGVFMENSSSSTSTDHPGKYVKTDDPLYPCNWLDQKYAKICYRYQSSYFALITNHDWKKVAQLCLQVPSQYQDECFRTVGTNQVGFTQDVSQMQQNCDSAPTSHFKQICIAGIVSSFAYRFVGDDKKIASFCARVKPAYQEACFRQMGVAVADWTRQPDKIADLCNQITNPQHKMWCKDGSKNI